MRKISHLLLALTVIPLYSQSSSALQFFDSTGTKKTSQMGWAGSEENGQFFIKTPNGSNVFEAKNNSVEIKGTLSAQSLKGNGAELTNLPLPQGYTDSLAAKASKAYVDSKVSSIGNDAIDSTKIINGSLSGSDIHTNAKLAIDSIHTKKGIRVEGGVEASQLVLHGLSGTSWGYEMQANKQYGLEFRTRNGSGSPIYFDDYGRVGLGTSLGSGSSQYDHKLQVAGEIAFYGPGLDGSTYERMAMYSDATYNTLFEAPSKEGGINKKSNYHFSWRGDAVPGSALTILGKNGNVGIGTNDPQTKLDVNGPIRIKPGKLPYNGTSPGALQIDNEAENYSAIRFVEGVEQKGTIHYFSNTWGGASYSAGTINIDGTKAVTLGSYNEPLLYAHQIDKRVGIGTTDPQHTLHVVGDIYATRSNTLSDSRYKTNIIPIDSSLLKILALKGVYYNWDISKWPSKNFSDKKQVGLIAQEVEKIIPEVVNTDSEGYKSLSYDKLTAVLINALQELEAENKELKKSAASILSRLEALEGKIK